MDSEKDATGAEKEKFKQFEHQAQERIDATKSDKIQREQAAAGFAALTGAARAPTPLQIAQGNLDSLTGFPNGPDIFAGAEQHIRNVKGLRRDIDDYIGEVRDLPFGTSRETSLAVTKLQEAVMWLGMELKRMKDLGFGEDPYPHSKDPSSQIIDPTADGLKL